MSSRAKNKLMSNTLYRKLSELGIPYPPEEVTDSKVTRWGHNKRYWAVQFSGGYAICPAPL
jgi:hypothetical protein